MQGSLWSWFSRWMRIFPILIPLQQARRAFSMLSPLRITDTPHSLFANVTLRLVGMNETHGIRATSRRVSQPKAGWRAGEAAAEARVLCVGISGCTHPR